MTLFEDSKEDVLSELYRAAYPIEVQQTFVYANGNGYIAGKAEELLKTSNRLLIFADTIADNESMRTLQERYATVVNRHKDKEVFVFNIVCAEYYFIKAFQDIFKKYLGAAVIEDLLCKRPYINSPLLVTEQDKKFAKTFEKYCKLVIKKMPKNCINTSSMFKDGCISNTMYGMFYKRDCLCEESDAECVPSTVSEKSALYTGSYPCRVYLCTDQKKVKLTNDELVDLHRRLVNEHNQWVKSWMEDAAMWNAKGRKLRLIRSIF